MNMSTQTISEMPSYTLNCQMSHEAAAMERLCQVIRIRGFRIARMTAESRQGTLIIALTLEGMRPIAMLQSQLEKLHTVAAVRLMPSAVTEAAMRSA
jgi:acetolactate synthase II small subunit